MEYSSPTLKVIQIEIAAPLALSLTGGTEPMDSPLQQLIEEDEVTEW